MASGRIAVRLRTDRLQARNLVYMSDDGSAAVDQLNADSAARGALDK
jgi:hypothetical protein